MKKLCKLGARTTAVSGVIAIFLIWTQAAQAQEEPVEVVISKQIQAIRSENFDVAFQYASPAIQKRIQSSSNFAFMIRNAFPILLSPTQIEFVDEKTRLPMAWQVVRLRGKNGKTFFFAYEMILIGENWRINGVLPLERPGQDV